MGKNITPIMLSAIVAFLLMYCIPNFITSFELRSDAAPRERARIAK